MLTAELLHFVNQSFLIFKHSDYVFLLFLSKKEVFTSHFYSSSDLNCSRNLLAFLISQLKTINNQPSKQKGQKKPALINAMENMQRYVVVSTFPLPEALLCLCSAWTSIKPWHYSELPPCSYRSTRKNNKELYLDFLITKTEKVHLLPFSSKVSLIPSWKSHFSIL